MKTAVSLPDDLFRAAERQAKRSQRSLSQLYAEALTEYLARHAPGEGFDRMHDIHRAKRIGFVMWLLLANPSSPSSAQQPLNLDFERASVAYDDRPWGWTFGWSAFASGPIATFALDTMEYHSGRRSLRITLPDSVTGAAPQAIMLQLPSTFVRGRDVELAGWVKVVQESVRPIITLEAWKDQEFAAADTAWVRADGANDGSHHWASHQVRIHVPDDSAVHSLVISLALAGPGTAWFDDFTISVDDRPLSTLPATVQEPNEAELSWLTGIASPLHTVRPPMSGAADDSDLAAIADIVAGARIVALGESTHGTREFFQVKHRLLDYLVREHGFTVFAIEANQLAVERVNRYVQEGSGTARDVMRVMFRVWNTEEMLGLVEWMRAYNAAHPARPVRFAGYDMQDHRTPSDTLQAFLERIEPAFLERFEALTGEYRVERGSATPHVADTVRARWARQADTLWTMVTRQRSTWLQRAASHADTVTAEWAVQSANLLRQAARFNVALSSPDRDSLMAANLDWLLRTVAPGARAVVWAHDVHVSHGGDPVLSFNGGAQMGAYLSGQLGYDYRAFSLLTYDGAYSATRSFSDHRMIEAAAFPAPPSSIEAALHRLERPESSVGWIVDLRSARTAEAARWLRQPRPIRHIGYAAYDYGFEFTAVLPLEFDGVVFIDGTAPSRLLP